MRIRFILLGIIGLVGSIASTGAQGSGSGGGRDCPMDSSWCINQSCGIPYYPPNSGTPQCLECQVTRTFAAWRCTTKGGPHTTCSGNADWYVCADAEECRAHFLGGEYVCVTYAAGFCNEGPESGTRRYAETINCDGNNPPG